jgi:hypothetical protein
MKITCTHFEYMRRGGTLREMQAERCGGRLDFNATRKGHEYEVLLRIETLLIQPQPPRPQTTFSFAFFPAPTNVSIALIFTPK